MAWKKTQPIYMYPAHKYSKVVSLISRIDDDSFRLKGLHLNMYNHLYRSHRAAAIPMQSWSVLVHVCYVYAGMFIHFSRQSNEEEKKTFRCQIWTKVIWIVSGYLVFFFLSNFFFIFVCFVWMWCWVYVKSALTHWRSDWSQQRKTICFWKTLREYRRLRYWAAKSMNCLRCVDILHMFACCFHPVPFAVVSYFATKMLRMFT